MPRTQSKVRSVPFYVIVAVSNKCLQLRTVLPLVNGSFILVCIFLPEIFPTDKKRHKQHAFPRSDDHLVLPVHDEQQLSR